MLIRIDIKHLYINIKPPKDADGMVDSAVLDQAAPLGVVCSGFTLFALAFLCKNLRKYYLFQYWIDFTVVIDIQNVMLKIALQ